MHNVMGNAATQRRSAVIAILSFDRPVYLAKMLVSLKDQLLYTDKVYLFQDGAFNPHSNRQKSEDRLIERCVDVFRAIIPHGIALRSEINLGIAGNYRRAEDYIFNKINAVSAVFLEDDLVLSPHYFDVMDQLLHHAEKNGKIGYVSAYGDLWAQLPDQRRNAGQLRPMHENWGFGLTKTSWLLQADIRNAYWEIIQNVDYSYRPHENIIFYYKSLGYSFLVTSQDGARWIACAEAGLARITTATCNAVYIGEVGEHNNEYLYNLYGFAHSIMFPDRQQIESPQDKILDEWIVTERRSLLEGYLHPYVSRIKNEVFENTDRIGRENNQLILRNIDAIAIETLYNLVENKIESSSSSNSNMDSDIFFSNTDQTQITNDLKMIIVNQGIALAATRDQNAALAAELSSTTTERDVALVKQASHQAEIASMQALLEAAVSNERQLEYLFARLAMWSAEFHKSTASSLSWRLTKPLRMIGIGRPKRPPMPDDIKSKL